MGKGFESESANPLYRQLLQKLKQQIQEGQFPVGSRLPSEEELRETYSLSRITVRKALAELTREGLVERKQGKGTFVSTPSVYHSELHAVPSFHEACERVGRKASGRVINARIVNASEADVEELHVAVNSKVVEITRLRMADGVPVMLEINHFSMGFSYLLESDLNGSLYNILKEYDITPTQATHDISLCTAGELTARYLGISHGTPLIFLHEVIVDQKGRPLHSSRQYIRGDLFTLRI